MNIFKSFAPSRPEIGLDIDGVLANFIDGIVKAATRMGLQYSLPRRWYYFREWFSSDNNAAFAAVFETVMHDEAFWMSLKPHLEEDWPNYAPGAYITSRPIASDVTKAWLDKWEFPVADVVTVSGHGGGSGPAKEDALRARGITRYIEDNIENYEHLRAAGIDCYLLDRPWNVSLATSHRIYTVNAL